MTSHVSAADAAETARRWEAWKLRGGAGDRRRNRRMTGVALVLGIGLAIALVLQLV